MENKFLMIPHKFFEEIEGVGVTPFYQIGTEGFTVWSYLLMTQGSGVIAQTSIKRIKAFLNRGKESNSKQKSKKGLSDARTIKKYLKALQRIDAIEIDIGTIENARADEELFIKVNSCLNENEGFSRISTQLFFDYVHKWGHIGWSIYCLLYKLHNSTFGSDTSFGFANPSREFIGKIIKRHESTISEYVNSFPKSVVKVEQQECLTYFNAIKNQEEQKQESNHYIVWAKVDPSNKYYVQ